MTYSGGVTETKDCTAYIVGETSGLEPTVAWIIGGDFMFRLTGMKDPYPGTYTTANTNASTGRAAYGYGGTNQKQWDVDINGGHVDRGDFSLQFASVKHRLPEGLDMAQGTFDANCQPDTSGTTDMLKIHAVF